MVGSGTRPESASQRRRNQCRRPQGRASVHSRVLRRGARDQALSGREHGSPEGPAGSDCARRELLSAEGDLEFRTSGEFIFINATRLRLDLENYTSFSHLLSLFRNCGIGSLRVKDPVGPRDWLVLISQLQTLTSGSGEPETRYFQLQGKLEQANVAAFEVGVPTAQDDGKKSP